MRCSCGQHDLPEGKPLRPCHFCGHATVSRPVVDWEIGKLWYPICHTCTQTIPFERQGVSVHSASPELVAEAYAYGYAFGSPAMERRA